MSRFRLLQDCAHLENGDREGGLCASLGLGRRVAVRLGLGRGPVANGLEPTTLLDAGPVLEDGDDALLVVVLEGGRVGSVGDLAGVVGLAVKEGLLGD